MCVVHVKIILTDFINVILFQCIQIFSLPPCYNFHGICYCFVYMSSVQYMVSVSKVTTVASNVMNVFFVSGIECTSHLSDVLQWTMQAFHLLNSTSTIFLSLWLRL